MEFQLNSMTDEDAITISCAIGSVDPNALIAIKFVAKTVTVESWLVAEEFLTGFRRAG
jgi:copper chaperone